ncbi:DUF2244 domain-containing protein [Marinobacter vulgaris]|uniref:DUF2244 domain-containing protein n=1 Tax=Marinobacter vulgaris TaxID=1928331 RepID=A0A2V3ZHV9_9GAMM|nr:DUF2244 domain-containing protein [Marinobacter vulgaris]PXX89724.1 DUF2244 domain-containing protein [Marinobacter vulgaris]TSJ68715.1 DUF2244 domain-containing protein [Marinobacter vulgaris]
MVEQLSRREGDCFLLTPNRSMSWKGNIRIWLAAFILSMLISTGMLLVGAWPVLPFAGLELTALAAGFYYTSRKCQKREVLTFSQELIRLEKGLTHKEKEWELPRQYTRVWQDVPRHPWTPPKLHLQFRGEEISLAPFLNIDDTEELVAILEKKGLRVEKRRRPEKLWF